MGTIRKTSIRLKSKLIHVQQWREAHGKTSDRPHSKLIHIIITIIYKGRLTQQRVFTNVKYKRKTGSYPVLAHKYEMFQCPFMALPILYHLTRHKIRFVHLVQFKTKYNCREMQKQIKECKCKYICKYTHTEMHFEEISWIHLFH